MKCFKLICLKGGFKASRWVVAFLQIITIIYCNNNNKEVLGAALSHGCALRISVFGADWPGDGYTSSWPFMPSSFVYVVRKRRGK